MEKKIINKDKKFDKIFVYGTSPIIQALIAIYLKKIKSSNNFVGSRFMARECYLYWIPKIDF